MFGDITPEELHILEHATGWKSRQPLYRNRYVTDEGDEACTIIQELIARGLMRCTRGPTEWLGGMSVFGVTEEGIEVLRGAGP